MFDADTRIRLSAGNEPFGTVLAEAGIAFRARIGGFFRMEIDPTIAGLGGSVFGRAADIVGEDGRGIARVMEIPSLD